MSGPAYVSSRDHWLRTDQPQGDAHEQATAQHRRNHTFGSKSLVITLVKVILTGTPGVTGHVSRPPMHYRVTTDCTITMVVVEVDLVL